MIRSQINVFERFGRITEQVEAAAVDGVNAAVHEAARVAQDHASIDLDLELIPAHGDVDGYTGGIKSKRTSSSGRQTPIARFFDQGTLGKRRRPTKRPRKTSWTVNRADTTYTAHRGQIEGKGIAPEGFFGKARAAGRRALLARIAQR